MRRSLIVLLAVWCGACGGGGGGGDSGPGDVPAHARGASSLLFDGIDDLANIPTASWGVTPLTQGVTLEAWIRPVTLVASPNFAGILAVEGQILTLNNSGGGSDQSVFACAISVPGTSNAASPLGTLQAGVWQHVAGTYDGTTIRIYLDGTLVGTRVHPGTATSPSNAVIGNWDLAFPGAIDEVRIWNRVRTQAEIAAAKDVALTGGELGLLGYYRFEGTGQVVVDSSARGASGTLGTDLTAEATDPVRTPN